jgi:biopolymer transport protein ExbD
MSSKLIRKKEEPEIPTASMADIAFLLIVFFMLTTVFSANKGMEHILPPKDDTEDPVEPEEAIYIHIFPGGNFEMDKTSYSIEQVDKVFEYVNGKVQVNAKKPIIVHTNREAKYGDMISVLDQLKLVSASMKQELAITIPSKQEAARYAQFHN